MPVLLLPYADLGNLAEHIQRRVKESRLQPQAAGPDSIAAWAAEPLEGIIQLGFGLRGRHESEVGTAQTQCVSSLSEG